MKAPILVGPLSKGPKLCTPQLPVKDWVLALADRVARACEFRGLFYVLIWV